MVLESKCRTCLHLLELVKDENSKTRDKVKDLRRKFDEGEFDGN